MFHSKNNLFKDVVDLTQKLIRFPSRTPDGLECLNFISFYLRSKGFICHELSFNDVSNLYARRGTTSPHICFVGHVDVVEEGKDWLYPPFEGIVHNNLLYGRGACDMKGSLAAFMMAIDEVDSSKGSISLLLTSDEEGPALFGTAYSVEWLKQRNEKIDFAITGEPTSVEKLADTIKVGRRGSLSGTLTVSGKMGHVAYPNLAYNPIPPLLDFIKEITSVSYDKEFEHFSSSHLEITSLETDTASCNVIPSLARACFNIRFNPSYTLEGLKEKFIDIARIYQERYCNYIWSLDLKGNAHPFYVKDIYLWETLQKAIYETVGYKVDFSTSGGTSDARFIKDLCPVIELGLFSNQAHQKDECVCVDDLIQLKNIYSLFLKLIFSK